MKIEELADSVDPYEEAHNKLPHLGLQQNFDGSNTDGSFTKAVSNSFLSP